MICDEDVLEWKLLVYKIAHIYWRKMNMRAELEDYIGEGFLGLIRGLIDYDVARNPNKKAFLSARISWGIIAAIKRDDPTTRRGYEQGDRAMMHSIAEFDDVFVNSAREVEQRMAVLDLERLFAVMLAEERAEFQTFLDTPHDSRAQWSAKSFERSKKGVSKTLVSGFSRMQSVLRLHRTAA